MRMPDGPDKSTRSLATILGHAPRSAFVPGRRARVPEKAESIPESSDSRRRAESPYNLRSPVSSQPIVEQLSRSHDPPQASGGGPQGDRDVRRRIGVGSDDCG